MSSQAVGLLLRVSQPLHGLTITPLEQIISPFESGKVFCITNRGTKEVSPLVSDDSKVDAR
jgi:hypothetical protein